MPYVVGDRVPKHYDYSLGTEVNSRAQQNRLLAEKDMRLVSPSEHKQRFGGPPKRGVGYSYAGQTAHKSTAERRQLA